jgi:hypothetical protein
MENTYFLTRRGTDLKVSSQATAAGYNPILTSYAKRISSVISFVPLSQSVQLVRHLRLPPCRMTQTIERMSMTTGALREYSATKEWQNNGPAIIVHLFPDSQCYASDGCSDINGGELLVVCPSHAILLRQNGLQISASLSTQKPLNVFQRYASDFFEPATSHLSASPSSRNKGLLR